MHARILTLVSLLVIVAGCSAGGKDHYDNRKLLAARDCVKNPLVVADYLDEILDAKSCEVDTDCDCGMHCDLDGFCTARCVTTDFPGYSCPADSGLECDNWGRCEPPAAPEPPDQLAVMTASPVAVELDAPAPGDPFVLTEVEVVLTTDDPAIAMDPAEHPVVIARGGLDEDPACTDEDDTTPCEVTRHSELQVTCELGGTLDRECVLDTWTFTPDGDQFRAVRSVWARPIDGAVEDVWELRLLTDETAGGTVRVSFTRRVDPPAPFEGEYAGALELQSPDGNGVALRVPVRGHAIGDALLLMDDSRVLSANGRLLVRAGESSTFAWLGSGGDVQVAAAVDTTVLAHDPRAGVIQTAFAIRLPRRDAAVPERTLRWGGVVTRVGDLQGAACADASACGAGSYCELDVCVPLPRWEPLPLQEPVNALVYEPLHEWADSLASVLGSTVMVADHITGDAIERLWCYDGSPSFSAVNAVFGAGVLPESGDLRCANGEAPVANQLPLLQDLGVHDSVEDLLETCLVALDPATGAPSTVSINDCLSRSNVLPGIAALASSSPQRDARIGLLLQHAVRGWVVAHAFVANQAVETWRLSGATGGGAVNLAGMLDRIAASWELVLDDTVSDSLMAIPPDELLDPDYRGSNRPAAYWHGMSTTDSAGDYDLYPSIPAYTLMSGEDGPLVGDTTWSTEMSFEGFVPDLSKLLIESPWLSVKVMIAGPRFYERGYRRSGNYWANNADTWQRCHELCAETGTCFEWSWFPATKECRRHYVRGARVADAGAVSGFVREITESWASTPITETSIDRPGGDYKSFTSTGEANCRDTCESDYRCRAWAYAIKSKYCWHKGNGALLPVRVPKAGIISGLTREGKRVQNKLLFDDDTDYYGGDYKSLHAGNWGSCYQACQAEAACKVWSFSKSSGWCWLKSTVMTKGSNPYVMSGKKAGLEVVVTHQTPSGLTEEGSVLLTTNLHWAGDLAVVRKTDDNRYLVYANGARIGQIPFTEPAYYRDTFYTKIGRSEEFGLYADAVDTAIYPTALDDIEIAAISQRRRLPGHGAVARGTLTLPSNPNHEQHVGLAVTMVEGLENELELLDAYVGEREGEAYAQCSIGAAPAVRDALLGRIGDTARRGELVEQLADAMLERAAHVPCRSDAACADYGGQCGRNYPEAYVDALTMTFSGSMRSCIAGWWTEAHGLCAPEGSGNSLTAPGTLGSASATFTIEEAGTYDVWARVVGADATSNSFWVRVDGGPWWHWEPPVYRLAWVWRRISDVATAPGGLRLELSAGPHTIDVAVREDGAFLRDILFTKDQRPDPPGTALDVCMTPDDQPVVRDVPWAQRYTDAVAGARGVRARVLERATRLAACSNPLGIDDSDLPLYFRDPVSDDGRYFASSDYMLSLADGAVLRAENQLDSARGAWVSSKDAEFQRAMTIGEIEARVEHIATGYETQLGDLCGIGASVPGDLLEQMASGTLPTASCFVQATASCAANFEGPIADAEAGCYRGLLGESLLGMKFANQRVQTSRQVWDARQTEWERQAAICLELETNENLTRQHYEHLAELRKKKAAFDKMSRYLGFAAGVSGGIASSLLSTSQLASATEGSDVPFPLGLVSGLPASVIPGASVLTGIAAGVFGLFGANVADQIRKEQEEFEETMAMRSAAIAVQECWAKADNIRDGINTAAMEMDAAAIAFEQSTLAFANRRDKVEQLVAQGIGAVRRETNRSRPRPAHHFWLDEEITRFRGDFEWAKRLSYLAMRAVEYDLQMSLGLRDDILDATSPIELRDALDDMFAVANTREIPYGGRPTGKKVVKSLARDILGFTGTNTEVRQKLRDYLRSRSQRITDRFGNVIGQGVRFVIDPGFDDDLADYCGERLWSVNAHVDTEQLSPPHRARVRLYKRNTFYGQWCGPAPDGEVQLASIRPTRNLFLPDSISTPFTSSSTYTPADIDAVVNGPLADLHRDDYHEGAADNLAARALYGEYILLFDVDDDDLHLGELQDVHLRFDFLSGSESELFE